MLAATSLKIENNLIEIQLLWVLYNLIYLGSKFYLMQHFSCAYSHATEAEAGENYFYTRTARRFGGVVRQNSVSGHIHARRGGAENQPPRVSGPGELSTKNLLFIIYLNYV